MKDFTLFAGSANRRLAEGIAGELGAPVGRATTERFPDGEMSVHLDESVRGREVFVVQPTAPPVNDHLVELLAYLDACRHAAAARVTAVVPYFGYARGDKRSGRRAPIMASLVAELLQRAGADHVVTVDVHSPQLEGYFRIPLDNLSAVPLLADALREQATQDCIVVAPDLGAVERATEFAALLDRPLAMLHKERTSGREVAIRRIVGEIARRRCIVVDDMISTGGTIVEAARALREAGAEEDVVVVATHGVFVGDAIARLHDAGVRELVVTDTVAAGGGSGPAPRVVSAAPLLAELLRELVAGR